MPQIWNLDFHGIIYNWVKKEPHEMVNLSPAVKKIRSGREATNGAFKSELFRAG